MTTRTRWTKTMSATVAALSAALGMAEGNLDLADAPPEVREKAEFYNQAVEWREKGRLDQALEAFQSLLAGAESDPCPDCRRLYSGAANNAGLILLQQLEAGRAEFYFRQAVAWDSENALAWNNLGAALLREGRFEEAQEAWERACRENPFLALPYNNLGRLLLEMGRLQLAGEFLLTALRLNPGDPETLFLLARLYRQVGLPEKQKEVWAALCETSGQAPENTLLLASQLLQEGSAAEAEPLVRKILAQRPGWPEGRLLKARWHACRQEWNEAEGLLRDLLKDFPGDAAVRQDLVAVLWEQNRGEEALRIAEEGTRRFPTSPENWYGLGLCRDRRGDRRGAEAAFRRCVEIRPDYARAWNDLGVLAAGRNDAEAAYEAFSRALAADPFLVDARYNLGRFLIMTQRDFDRGLLLVAAVAEGRNPRAAQANQFINDLILIARGGDPGWGAKR
jgi:superkiller protein 3